MKSQNRFVISDTHFNHENIIRYCDRPFANAKEMNEAIIENWNSIVKSKDVVYHGGDFGFGDITQLIDLRNKLNGTMRLILGNHDKRYNLKGWLKGILKFDDHVYDCPIILDDFFILSHYPIFLEANSVFANIYGHLHQNLYSNPKNLCYFNMCVEQHDYKPVAWEDVSACLEKSSINIIF
jgi:calcineurin-like phosphoesterase family protein